MIKVNYVPYIGNSELCWANAASMLLASIGETVSPSYLETVSGLGLSAFIMPKNNWLYFQFALPDQELSYNLKKLGFICREVIVSKKEAVPLEQLKKDLQKSPVVVGPINMGLLTYNPQHEFLNGVDHFILIYGSDDDGVYLHDPDKYPCIPLSYKTFELVWKSKNIVYGSEHYHYWTDPKRISFPKEEKIYRQTINDFISIYKNCDRLTRVNKLITGKEAILTAAKRFASEKFKSDELNVLIYSSLPLATKRALDLFYFFKSRNPELANFKKEQATLFGKCQILATTKKWKKLGKTLEKLAEIEEGFRLKILDRLHNQ